MGLYIMLTSGNLEKKQILEDAFCDLKLNKKCREIKRIKRKLLGMHVGTLRLVVDVLEKLKRHRVVIVFSPTQSGKTTAMKAYALAKLLFDLSWDNGDKKSIDYQNPVKIFYTNSINLTSLYNDACFSFSENINLRPVRSPDLKNTDFSPVDVMVFDELHYAAKYDAIYIQHLISAINNNNHLRAILISATPLTAFIALFQEFGSELGLVMHNPGEEEGYTGIMQYNLRGQLMDIGGKTSLLSSKHADAAYRHYDLFTNGVMLVRAQPRELEDTYIQLRKRYPKAIIYTNSANTQGVNKLKERGFNVEHLSVAEIRTRYEYSELSERKLIILTTAQLRAGDDLGQKLKSNLRVVWESSKSNVASVIQGLAGRSTGYIENRDVKIFLCKRFVDIHLRIHRILEKLYKNEADINTTMYDLYFVIKNVKYDNCSDMEQFENLLLSLNDNPSSILKYEDYNVEKRWIFSGHSDTRNIEDHNVTQLINAIEIQIQEKKTRLPSQDFPWAKASWSKRHKFHNINGKSRLRSSGLYDSEYIDAIVNDDIYKYPFTRIADLSSNDKLKTKYHAFVFSSELFMDAGENLNDDDMRSICCRLNIDHSELVIVIIKRGNKIERKWKSTKRKKQKIETNPYSEKEKINSYVKITI